MRFSLDVRRARKGDCLLLHYGTKEDPGLAVIDGGPAGVYKPHLRPRLMQIREARGVPADAPLWVDLLMVSHVDSDHIQGLLDLTHELVIAQMERRPKFTGIRNCWHNTFDDIIGNPSDELLASLMASYGLAAADGSFDPEGVDPELFDPHSALALAGVKQGRDLRNDLKTLEIPLNRRIEGKLVMADGGGAVSMGKGLGFTVAGPMKAELLALQAEHDRFLKKQQKDRPALAAFTDDSIANLSSLVIMAEVDGKRMLLTGDARGDMILKGMEQVGLLAKGGSTHVEILKVPHHGSNRNMETRFFERVTADHYVFSGNGEHGNPERETFQMLLDARGDAPYSVHLTYPVDEIDEARKREWDKKRAREQARHVQDRDVKVRDEWSPAKHSIAEFLKDNPAFRQKVKIVPKDAAHVIDLHEPLGF